MIFRISALRTILNVPFTVKPFSSTLNVRFLCNIQAGNTLPKSAGLIDRALKQNQKSVEKLYFKNIMENNPKYPDLNSTAEILKANENSANKLVAFFRIVAANNQNSQQNDSERFELTDLTDYEDDVYTMHDIIEVFHLFFKCCELFSQPLKSELEKLSVLMEKKIKELKKTVEDIGPMLTFLNLMKDVEAPQNVPFYVLSYIYKKYKKLTTVQLIEYSYILHYYKLLHEKESKYLFEVIIVDALPKLNIDEVAVLSYAFFRAELLPGSLLCEAISGRVLEEVESLNDIQACSLFKFFKYSGRRRISENLIKIFEKCIPIIDRFTLMTAVHIVDAGVSVNTESKELFQLVWDRANKEFDNLRLKDIERLFLASLYTNFRIPEDSRFVQLTLQRFNKENNEIHNYPRPFFSLLKFLIMHNIYPEDLITYATSNEYQETVKKKYSKYFFEELVFIESSVELERPEYNLNPLRMHKKRKIVMKTFRDNMTDSSSFTCNNRIVDVLKEIYDNESVVLIRPLLHYVTLHPILCINRKNEPQKIGDKLTLPDFTTIKAPEDGNLWIAFVLLRWQACLYDRVTPNLVSEAKLRHFRKAGYIPITAHNFLLVDKTKEQMKEMLKEAIRNNIPSLKDCDARNGASHINI